ncbi:MAG: response regulator transcription factor [Elusimicrobia bacterium]|nr:response regulator transcription factor [Elusimicrobiota bacterium]
MSAQEKAKLLLVEDEEDIGFILDSVFKSEGYSVVLAKTAEAGLEAFRKQKPDLIVTDIMLPKMDGLEMVRIIRRESRVPVLFLTAKRAELDRIKGFKLGADDYLSKPFSTRELVCRVQAVLRRAANKPAASKSGLLRIGKIEVDSGRHEVRINGKYKRIAPREFQLLTMLIEANGGVLSRDQLLSRIWGYDNTMKISTRTVDQHVARLRRGLGPERKRIVTVKNFGYKIRSDD